MVLIGIDPYPTHQNQESPGCKMMREEHHLSHLKKYEKMQVSPCFTSKKCCFNNLGDLEAAVISPSWGNPPRGRREGASNPPGVCGPPPENATKSAPETSEILPGDFFFNSW